MNARGMWLMATLIAVAGALAQEPAPAPAPAGAGINVEQAKNKALARRAAEADAYRKLAEVIKGLQITSDTYVRDFVAESDQIQAALDTMIKGVRLGEPRWYEDGSCEVPAEVTVAKVIQTLQEIHRTKYKGNKIKVNDFDQINKQIKKDVISVVGQGAPRPDLPPDLPAGVADQFDPQPAPSTPIPDLWRQIPPQARFGAERAAELDAKRKLLERIQGVRINSQTLVRDFVTEYDNIDAHVQGLIIGATKVKTYFHHDEPIVEVTVRIPVESVVRVIDELHQRSVRGDDVRGMDISNVGESIRVQYFEATGMGVPRQELLRRMVPAGAQPYPEWAAMPIRATGNGVPPADKAGTAQGKLLAARAAELDAKRKLAEHIFGLNMQSQTRIRDFAAESDEINGRLNAVIAGATIERTIFRDDGSAEVTVSVPGMQVYDVANSRPRGR